MIFITLLFFFTNSKLVCVKWIEDNNCNDCWYDDDGVMMCTELDCEPICDKWEEQGERRAIQTKEKRSFGWVSGKEKGWKNDIPTRYRQNQARRSVVLPENYNIYDDHPKCDNKPPMDQKDCGVCWIFAVAQAMSDRICVAYDKFGGLDPTTYTDFNLSTQSMTSCYGKQHAYPPTSSSNNVCDGGYIHRAIEILYPDCHNRTGHYCGAPHEQCWKYQPYTSNPFGREVLECPQTTRCPHANKYDWLEDRMYAMDYRSPIEGPGEPMVSNVQAIKEEIYHYGPIVVGFKAYGDFMDYEDGIYVSNEEGGYGGHAVEIIGWGVENGTEYWFIKNSWGKQWGAKVGKWKGYIKFKMRQCAVEREPYAPCPIYNCDNAVDKDLCQEFQTYCKGPPRESYAQRITISLVLLVILTQLLL